MEHVPQGILMHLPSASSTLCSQDADLLFSSREKRIVLRVPSSLVISPLSWTTVRSDPFSDHDNLLIGRSDFRERTDHRSLSSHLVLTSASVLSTFISKQVRYPAYKDFAEDDCVPTARWDSPIQSNQE